VDTAAMCTYTEQCVVDTAAVCTYTEQCVVDTAVDTLSVIAMLF